MIKKPWRIMAFAFIVIPLFSQQVVELEEVLRFGDVPEKEIYFENPRAIKLDDDGNIYIQDRPHILKFGPDGKFLVRMIRVGQGPGEMPDGYVGNLSDFFVAKNKVIAFSYNKVLWFNEKGEFQEEKRVSRKGVPNFIVTPDLNYYAFERISPRRDEVQKVGPYKYTMNLWRISPDYKEKELIYTWQVPGNVSRPGRYSFRAPRYLSIDSETLIVNITGEYEFFSFDLKKNKITKTFTREYKRKKGKNWEGRTIYFPAIYGFHYVKPKLWVVTSTLDKNENPLIHSWDLKTGEADEFYLKYPKSEDDIKRRHDYNFFAIAKGFLYTIEQNSKGFYNIVKYRMKTGGESLTNAIFIYFTKGI